MPPSASYDAVAKLLHWTIALAIIGMLALGWTMADLPRADPMRFQLFQWHKSIGITILLLSLLRLGWRLGHPVPPLPDSMPLWEKRLARTTVILFYALIIGMPFTGWIIVSSSPLNIPTMLYGIFPWPDLPILPSLAHKREIGKAFAEVHGYLAFFIVGLLCLHVAGALKHHFMDRDDILTRMAPAFLTGFLDRIRRWG
jgi:cytochrome b561